MTVVVVLISRLEVEVNVARYVHSSVNKLGVKRDSGL